MLIKDLLPISENLYQAALDNQEAQGNKRDPQVELDNNEYAGGFDWDDTPQNESFWFYIHVQDFDAARRIDKEKGWGLFDPVADDTEAVKEMRGFQPGDKVVAISDGESFYGVPYSAGDIFDVVDGCPDEDDDIYVDASFISRRICVKVINFKLAEESISEEMESLAKKAVEVTEKEKAEFDKMTPAQQDAHIDKWAQDLTDSMFNQSAINDGLPTDYVPPQAPRKAISFLYNDKQREEAERIDRARKRARFV